MLVCAFPTTNAHETAGAARTRSSLRPLFWRGRERNTYKPRAHRAARMRRYVYRHCERSEAIHGAAKRKNGLLRSARNDGGLSRPAMTISWAPLLQKKQRASKPQHHLRDDLALDLRRAAEDRVRPAVEIFRHHRQHFLRNPRFLVELVER